MILYGMGVCQFGQAVDVVKGLASIALLTGNFGRKRWNRTCTWTK